LALREKKTGEFAKLKFDLEANVVTIGKAVAAIEESAVGACVQTSAVSLVRSFAMEHAELPDAMREESVPLLSG